MPTYDSGHPYYYTCTQTTYSSGNPTWTTVARCKGIEDANATANTANTNASNAVTAVGTANTNASDAVRTANEANSIANNALNGLKIYVGTSSTPASEGTKIVNCDDTDF